MSEVGRRVCLFGGSFDPPHVCHVLSTAWALSTLPLDELWWVPTYSHAFGKSLRPFEDRMAMCAAAISCFDDRVRVSDVERSIGGESRTLRTVETLLEQDGRSRISLLFGADIMSQTHRWEGWERLQQLTDIHVIGRGTHPLDGEPEFAIILPDVSSSALRTALAQGDLAYAAARLPQRVLDLIVCNGWYGCTGMKASEGQT